MQRRIAYFTGSYPALTETFVQREISFLRDRGWLLPVFAFAPIRNVQDGSLRASLNRQTHYGRYSGILLGSIIQFIYLVRNPRGYFRCLGLIAAQVVAHPLPIVAKQIAYFLAAAAFSWTIERQDIEHVHAHFATASTIALFVHLLTGRNFSMAAHASGDIYTSPIMLEEKLREAEFVVAESEYNRLYLNLLTNDRYATKIQVIYNGVDIAPIHFERHSPSELHIVSVAGLRIFKGFPTLIDALAKVHSTVHTFRCTIVGDGPLRSYIQCKIDELGLAEHIQLIGAQENERVVEVMKSADIFVLASEIAVNGIRDGLPTVCTEALALGLPVISTYISGIPELIMHEQTGLLVPEKRPDLLADAIIRLMEDAPLRSRLASAGYAHVLCNFNQANTLLKLEQLFYNGITAASHE